MNTSTDALRVLIVEDEQGVLAALTDFVRELGCQPVGARTAEEALRVIESERELTRTDEHQVGFSPV